MCLFGLCVSLWERLNLLVTKVLYFYHVLGYSIRINLTSFLECCRGVTRKYQILSSLQGIFHKENFPWGGNFPGGELLQVSSTSLNGGNSIAQNWGLSPPA